MGKIIPNHKTLTGVRFSWSAVTLMTSLIVLVGCQYKQLKNTPTVSKTTKTTINRNAGNFLAARQALYLNDVNASAKFYLSALQEDEHNLNLLHKSFLTQYRNGNIELAAALARQLESKNIKVPYTVEPAIGQAIKAADWDAVIVLSEQLAEDMTTAPHAEIIKSWALVASGQGDGGLANLSNAINILSNGQSDTPPYALMQLALMSEYLGYNEEAIEYASKLALINGLPAKIALQTAGVLMRENQTEAAKIIFNQLPYSFNKEKLTANKFLRPKNFAAYISDAIVDVTLAYRDPKSSSMLPARLQLAIYLDPNNDPAHFFLAQTWMDIELFNRAKKTLGAIENFSLWAQPRLLLKTDIETKTGNLKTAIDIVDAFVTQDPENGYLLKELGDLYRRNEQYEKARDTYLNALLEGFDTADLHRNLGIAYERLGEDSQAETSFKKALQLNPDDPYTLNYLGYWWAESGRNLQESIKLIEKAVTLRPDSGFFVDSLGWVHYQLGNYGFAVEFLEKATVLEPADALITSHLGDAYWQNNRYIEARFKWRYAASITTDDELHDSLQEKLKYGLSATGD